MGRITSDTHSGRVAVPLLLEKHQNNTVGPRTEPNMGIAHKKKAGTDFSALPISNRITIML